MQRINLMGCEPIEVDNLEQRVAILVNVTAERDGEGRARLLAYFKSGEIVEVSSLEAESLKSMGIPEGTMDDVVEVTLYETDERFGHFIREDIETEPQDWLTSTHSECWTLRRCNVPLAMEKFVDFRRVLSGMQESALDLKEGRTTVEDVEKEVRRAERAKKAGFLDFLDSMLKSLGDKED